MASDSEGAAADGAVTVVIPTVGRPQLLRRTLDSLAACDPVPAEVLIADQSADQSSEPVAAESSLPAVRVIRSGGHGRGLAINEGLRAAVHDLVLITDDDCTVRPDWIAAAQRSMAEDPEGMITGQVLPGGGDPRAVPSTIELDQPLDYTGKPDAGALYGGNMACSRDAVIAIGGFDERIVPAAEDNDLCYRWITGGGRLRHVPELVVWHHDWRSPQQLEQHYVGYYEGNGRFYAKHLRRGDLRMLRPIGRDLLRGLRSLAASTLRSRPRWTDNRRGVFPGLLRGLRAGWREFG